jgi:uncharacterized protein YlxW (UPF0749 family)
MNKQSTRAFAAGLFLSAIILIIFSYYDEDNADPKDLLTDQGYVILTEEEAKQRNEEVSNLQEQVETLTKNNSETQEEKKAGDNDTAANTITLTVSPGMTPIEIADTLESSGIIRNASDLNSYLVNSGLADKIQIGEYQLDSDMTLEQISTILTN